MAIVAGVIQQGSITIFISNVFEYKGNRFLVLFIKYDNEKK